MGKWNITVTKSQKENKVCIYVVDGPKEEDKEKLINMIKEKKYFGKSVNKTKIKGKTHKLFFDLDWNEITGKMIRRYIIEGAKEKLDYKINFNEINVLEERIKGKWDITVSYNEIDDQNYINIIIKDDPIILRQPIEMNSKRGELRVILGKVLENDNKLNVNEIVVSTNTTLYTKIISNEDNAEMVKKEIIHCAKVHGYKISDNEINVEYYEEDEEDDDEYGKIIGGKWDIKISPKDINGNKSDFVHVYINEAPKTDKNSDLKVALADNLKEDSELKIKNVSNKNNKICLTTQRQWKKDFVKLMLKSINWKSLINNWKIDVNKIEIEDKP